MRPTTTSTVTVTARTIAAMALISGVMPRRIELNTYIGRVGLPGPGHERCDDEVVEAEREGEEGAGDDRRHGAGAA